MDDHRKCYFSSPTWAFLSIPGLWSITLAAHCTTSSISEKWTKVQKVKESKNSWSHSTCASNLSDKSKGADNSADCESLYTEVLFAFASLLECRVHGGTLHDPNKQVCVCVCVCASVCVCVCVCVHFSVLAKTSLVPSTSPPLCHANTNTNTHTHTHTNTHTCRHIGIQMLWAHSFHQLLAALTAAVCCCSREYDSFTGGQPS